MKIIRSIILIISIVLLIYSSTEIIKWYIENQSNNKTKKIMIELTNIEKDKDRYPFIRTNFNNLLKENNKVVGWIQVPNTNINYPVLQYTNNDYYLTHDFYDKYNSAGWVFLDYRNTKDNLDTSTILYAHNRLDNSMFGTLKNTLSQEWNDNNKYVYYNTLNTMNTYKVFSVYTINENEFKAYQNFSSDEEYKNYLNEIINRSILNLNVEVNETDKIITLYTCNKDNEQRTILHAKLIQTKGNS